MDLWSTMDGDVMGAHELAEAVARAAVGRNQTALVEETGLSKRTVREILEAAPRRFNRTTLDKLDGPLGWESGTAWRLYKQPRTAATAPDPSMVEELTLLVAEQLRREQEERAMVSLVGLPVEVASSIERLVFDIRQALARPRPPE